MTDLNNRLPISGEEFLRKIEKMYSEYIVEDVSCYMEPGFRYNSFWVLDEMKSAGEYVDYITAKVRTLKRENIIIKTKMMHIAGSGEPCLVLEQPDTEPVCLIAERSPDGLIARMDMMPAGFYRMVPLKGVFKHHRKIYPTKPTPFLTGFLSWRAGFLFCLCGYRLLDTKPFIIINGGGKG